MGRSILLIANPAAGRSPVADAPARAASALARLGHRVELYRTVGPGDAERAARASAGGFDLALAAGGDGTVHEIANGLAGSATALGVIPLGSMNILAREIGVPFDITRASEWISRAEPRPIALGRRGTRYFVLMAGIGYDAFALDLALRRASRSRRKVSFLDYVHAAWSAARSYEFPRIEVSSDRWHGQAAFGFVANCARYGGNLRIAREARLEEPALDLILFDSERFPDIMKFLLAVLVGRQARMDGVVYRKVEAVTVQCASGAVVPCQLDGERAAPLPAEIEVVPGALLLLRTNARSRG